MPLLPSPFVPFVPTSNHPPQTIRTHSLYKFRRTHSSLSFCSVLFSLRIILIRMDVGDVVVVWSYWPATDDDSLLSPFSEQVHGTCASLSSVISSRGPSVRLLVCPLLYQFSRTNLGDPFHQLTYCTLETKFTKIIFRDINM